MSVRFSEAKCLDSMKRRFTFYDTFWGDQLQDLWTLTVVSGGTGAVVDAQDGGIYRLSTPTASDSSLLDWGGATPIRSLHVLKKVTIETRVRFNGGNTDTNRAFGLLFDADEYIMFIQDVDTADIDIECNNAASTKADSGVDDDADWHRYRIECFPTGEVHFYIDGVQCANSPITTNIPTDAADYLRPYFYIATNADTNPATSMDIDYVSIRQQR